MSKEQEIRLQDEMRWTAIVHTEEIEDRLIELRKEQS